MNSYGNTKKTPKKKRHDKDVVVTKAHGGRVRGLAIKRQGRW